MVRILGNEFQLDGMPIDGLDIIGNALPINIPAGAVFSGVLANGQPFAFYFDRFRRIRGRHAYAGSC
jgi:hypothetical protein